MAGDSCMKRSWKRWSFPEGEWMLFRKISQVLKYLRSCLMNHANSPRTTKITCLENNGKQTEQKKIKNDSFEKQMEKSSHECFLIYSSFRQAFGEIFEICEAIWSQTVCDNLILFALASLIYWGHRSWWLDIFPHTHNPKMRNGKLKILFPQRVGERSEIFQLPGIFTIEMSDHRN